jgi:hypothetical protein
MVSSDKTGLFSELLKKLTGAGSPVGNFFESMKNRMGIGAPERNATDTYEREMKIVPECISAVENETPVKQYNIAVLRTLLKFERAEGRMQVTNKRVILRAAGRSIGGRTTLQQEFAVNEIAGIEAKRNFKFSFLFLVFAILVTALAFLIIYRPPAVSGIMSPIQSKADRIYSIMSPKHLQEARINEEEAVLQRTGAEEVAAQAEIEKNEIQEIVNEWEENAKSNPRRTYWFNRQYMTPQAILDLIIPERDKAEGELILANEQLESAKAAETDTVEKRMSAEKTWKMLMTVLGAILGIGGLIPFFALYKKFGLKLFILNISIFGFALSFAASGVFIFNWLYILSVIITLICIFIFCFRPNLVISVKNKTGEGPVDIRCNENLNRLMEGLSFAILILPVIIYWSVKTIGSSSDSILGPILIILPVILLIILLAPIVRLLQGKNGTGPDTGFAEVIPTEETESAIREIGAIIADIQKSGDAAVEKWTNK